MMPRLACLLLCVGCTAPWRPGPARGSEWVLALGRELEIAYSPLWCRDEPARMRVCLHMLSDSQQVSFQWDPWHRPLQVTQNWGRVSPLHAMRVRDSLRHVFESHGGRQIEEPPFPKDTSHGLHQDVGKWCVNGAHAWVVSSWQEGQPFEWVSLLVGAGSDPDCWPEFLSPQRPNQRMQPTSASERAPVPATRRWRAAERRLMHARASRLPLMRQSFGSNSTGKSRGFRCGSASGQGYGFEWLLPFG